MKTGLVWSERYAWHDAGSYFGTSLSGAVRPPAVHWDDPESKRGIYSLIAGGGLLEKLLSIEPRPATEEELLSFHTREYLDRLERLSAGRGGEAGEGSPFGPGGYEIARLATGGAVAAAEAVITGRADNAYALVRPAGHHAEPGRGRGTCLLANGVIAANYLRGRHGIERLAIVDWDAHHGNGAQGAFYSDPTVLTVSIHQDRFYPQDSGGLEENGEGRGRGANLNIPLPPGSGHGAYLAAFERVVIPALIAFKPEFIFVQSGLDASFYDPMGRMLCQTGTFREMTRLIKEAAAELCGGRLVLCHEGGYSTLYTPYCGLAIIEELSGLRSSLDSIFPDSGSELGGHELQPHQETVIEKVRELLDYIPS